MSSPRFLVVEDEPDVARAIARTLSDYGVVDVAGTCELARRRLLSTSYVGIISDVSLPDGSGLDVMAEAFRQSPTLDGIILSGEVDAGRLHIAHCLGVQYLLKPVEPDHIKIFALRALGGADQVAIRLGAMLDAWERTYGLTRAEAELLRLSVAGCSRGELARLRSVTESTILKQVQSLLGKTLDATLEKAVNRLLRETLGGR